MNVFWTDKAVEQLAAIHAYVSQVSPQYADRLVDRITRRTEQIESFPVSGRMVPEMQLEQIREVIESGYRIIYYVGQAQIDILAVLHGAQKTSL